MALRLTQNPPILYCYQTPFPLACDESVRQPLMAVMVGAVSKRVLNFTPARSKPEVCVDVGLMVHLSNRHMFRSIRKHRGLQTWHP